MKRTTLIMPSALHAELRARASAERRTLTDVVERALRLGLDAMSVGRRARVRLPSYDLGPWLADPGRREGWPNASGAPDGSAGT